MIKAVPVDMLDAPLSIHLLVTSRCNLGCRGCFYKHNEGEIPFRKVRALFFEWRSCGVRSVAIGGGEPLLHPEIENIIDLGRKLGFYMAVTTNGTILKDIRPNRLHVSFDEVHPTSVEDVETAIRYYRPRVGKIGINHIVRSVEGVMQLERFDVDTITLLKEKPISKFKEWHRIFKVGRSRFWYDACLSREFGWIKCRQGVTSMSINPSLEASVCSNLNKWFPYTSLKETWEKVRGFRCNV